MRPQSGETPPQGPEQRTEDDAHRGGYHAEKRPEGKDARRGRSRRLGGAGREAQRRPAEGEADEQGRSDGEGEGDRGAHDCHHAGLVAEIEKGTEARKAQTQDAGEDV